MGTERKVVVVTGASHGLGEAFVKAYRHRGWRGVGNAKPIAPSSDPDYITVQGDIGEPSVARKVVQTALDRFGRIDTLINNAGIWRPGRIEDISEEVFREVMRTNLDSVFFGTQAAVPAMKRQGGGHIVQISTSLVEHALQTVPAVVASLSKGACVAATRGLAMELASSNIRVNAISLGIVITPLHAGCRRINGHPLHLRSSRFRSRANPIAHEFGMRMSCSRATAGEFAGRLARIMHGRLANVA